MFTLSNTTVYTPSNAIFEQAKQDAIARFTRCWDSFHWNMWKTYNSELDPDWVDPWYERELNGIFNGPSTGPNDPAYEMTQNAFGIYCWRRYKGYELYSMAAMFTAHTIESTVSGGLWEKTYAPYAGYAPSGYPTVDGSGINYRALIGFNATRIGASPESYTWHHGGTIVPLWEAYAYDEYLEQTVSLVAPAGSWEAVNRYPIIMTAESIDGQIYRRPEYPLKFNELAPDPQYPGTGRGYGLVQWSPWVELVITAGAMLPDEGRKHWQLNLTLQLMVMEYERSEAMTSPGHQYGPDYRGQWIDLNSVNGWFTKQVGDNLIRINCPATCTWDQFATDYWVTDYTQRYAQQGIVLTDWDKIQLQMEIFRVCYLHTAKNEQDLGFFQKSAYFLAAIRYWDSHGGWNPAWIPRARDITECELDQYHVSLDQFILLASRRRKHHARRTILL